MAPTTSLSNSEPGHFQVAQFERFLLLADATALDSMGLPDAAAIARGSYSFLTSPVSSCSLLSSKLANDLISDPHSASSTPSLLTTTLHSAASGNLIDLCAIYTAGVGLLQAFLTINWAGPPLSQSTTSHASEAAATLLLVSDGEDVATPARCLMWLRAARRVLVGCVDEFVRAGAVLAPWWAARALLAHQAVLSGLAPVLKYDLFTMFARFLGPDVIQSRELYATDVVYGKEDSEEEEDCSDFFLPAPIAEGGAIEDEEDDFIDVLTEKNRVDARLKVLAYLELALAQKLYYDADGAWNSLQRACQIERIAFRVIGEMGVRTKHQKKSTAQLIAHAYEIMDNTNVGLPLAEFALRFPRNVDKPGANVFTGDQDKNSVPLPLPINIPVNDTDVLGYIRLTGDQESIVTTSNSGENIEGEGEQVALGKEKNQLTPIQQALALGRASLVRARNASHILTTEEMAPYVNLVIQNADSPFGTSSMVQIRALVLRVSSEQDRGRYLERCMSQMEELGDFIDNPMDSLPETTRNSAIAERNVFLFASSVPPRWELKKEIAISFGKIGLVKSAMEIFEKLEYWDELVDCHRLIGNLGAAEALVRNQLELLDNAVLEEGIIDSSEVSANVLKFGSQGAVHARAVRRPRLLCVLGDVTRDKRHLEAAWEESGFKYARAKRALARMCVEAEDWEEAVRHFKEALAINPLFPEAWFTYGCSAIQVNDMQLAARAFTTVVQQTPENGEAWNNLGRVLHEIGKTKEALKALSEAAKSKRDSWRIWNNILLLAIETRSSLDIVRSMERLLDLRGKDGVVAEPIGVAVAEIIRMTGSEDVVDRSLVGPVCRRLLKILGRCTALVSTNPSIWAAYAELHELVPDAGGIQKAFDCRLKQVRSLIAQGQWKSDRREFRHMALASDSLARDAVHSRNELSIRAAKVHLQSIIEQTKDDFKDDEGFLRLEQIRGSLVSNEYRERN